MAPLDQTASAASSPTGADHVIPLADGGSNDLENLSAAHIYCNSARSARRSTALRAQRQRRRRTPAIY